MKLVLSAVMGLGALMLATAGPAFAASTASQKCLVLADSVATSVAYDVCRCAVAKIDDDMRKYLQPDPARIAALCPIGNLAGGMNLDTPPDGDDGDHHHGRGFSFAKASSSSGVISGGTVIWGTPIAATIQGQHNKSLVLGDSAAGATAGTSGNASAGTYGSAPQSARVSGGQSSYASGSGGTSGSSCAGNAC